MIKSLNPLIHNQFLRAFNYSNMKKKMVCSLTRPQQELKVAQQLSYLGITNYCPTITLIKKYSDRKKKVNKPLLSGYLMIQLEDKIIKFLYALALYGIYFSLENQRLQVSEINLIFKRII